MINIGIIGSDNSHALAFSKLVNVNRVYEGVKITGIFGLDNDVTQKVATEGEIEKVYETADDMLSEVDAVMVVFRDGRLHYKYALPFIEKGLPTWIDKPFTCSSAETRELIETAEKSGCLLTGGSTLKYANDVLTLKNALEHDTGLGGVKGGYISFPGDITSEYNGLFFYGPHMVELLVAVFGTKIKSVETIMNGEELIAVAKYADFSVILDFVRNVTRFCGIVHGKNKTYIREIDISTIYRDGFNRFYNMLIDKKIPEPYENIIAPVLLLEAIIESYTNKKEVFLNKLSDSERVK